MAFTLLAALRLSSKVFDAHFAAAPSHSEAAGWSRWVGGDGLTFATRPLDAETTLVRPDAKFSSIAEISFALRALLGTHLDMHKDEQGAFVLPAGEEGDAKDYSTLLRNPAGSWIGLVPAGQSFAEIATVLKRRTPLVDEETALSGDVLAHEAARIAEKFIERESRSTLEQALGSAFGRITADERLGIVSESGAASDLGAKERAEADVLTRQHPHGSLATRHELTKVLLGAIEPLDENTASSDEAAANEGAAPKGTT